MCVFERGHTVAIKKYRGYRLLAAGDIRGSRVSHEIKVQRRQISRSGRSPLLHRFGAPLAHLAACTEYTGCHGHKKEVRGFSYRRDPSPIPPPPLPLDNNDDDDEETIRTYIARFVSLYFTNLPRNVENVEKRHTHLVNHVFSDRMSVTRYDIAYGLALNVRFE